ncbi:MAG: 5'-Nucleotidase domain protein [Bacteroidetes bacterium]|nr:5'-Nucleotidase domain protein [Bacteroidota bacterium]
MVGLIAYSALLMCTSFVALAQLGTTSADAPNPGAMHTDGKAQQHQERTSNLPQLPGWPQTMAVAPLYSPSGITLADLNGDDTLEIVAGSTDGKLYAWRYTGALLPNYPVTVGTRIQAPPAVADVNGDGTPEIAVTTSTATYLYRADGTLMPGWPKSILTNAFGFSAPVLYDIDNNGTLEVIQGSGSNTGNLGRIYIWRFDGTSVLGWPQTDGTSVLGWPQTLGNNYRINSTVSVGDLDRNGSAEIIAVAVKAGGDTVRAFAYHSDSTQVQGWPYIVAGMGASWSAAAIGNIDTLTASLEVAFSAGNFFGNFGSLYVVNANGTTASGFPTPLALGQNYPSVALGDVNRDGVLEIVCGGTGNQGLMYTFRNNGTVLPGWPQAIQTNMEGSAVIANVDTSASHEIIFGDNFTSNASLFAFTLNGQQSPQFPVTMAGAMSVNSAAVADVNRDGTLEIALVNSNGTVNLWTTDAPADSNSVEWGTFYHDNQHTGNYHFRPGLTTGVKEHTQTALPASFQLLQNYPNPFNPTTAIGFQLTANSFVSLKVFDLLSREIATLVEKEMQPGMHAVSWDATGFSSGVYLYRMRSGSFTQTRKLVLMR